MARYTTTTGMASYYYAMIMTKLCRRSPHVRFSRFGYYDPHINIIHDFLVLAHHPASSYPVPTFYEVVTTGTVLYLRQQNRCPLSPPQHVSPHKVAYQYFAYHNGQLIRAHRFEKDLLATLVQEDPTLANYTKTHRLRAYDVGDQIELVKYFNRRTAIPVAELSSFRQPS